MQNFNHPFYSRQDLINALHGVYGQRKVTFRYELLDKNNAKIKDLDCIIEGEVSLGSLDEIKRKAKFKLEDKGDINWFSDRIKAYMKVHIPEARKVRSEYAFLSHIHAVDTTDDLTTNKPGWVEFPLGVFLLAAPTRKLEGGRIIRDVDAFDGLLVLRDDKFESRHFIAKDTNYKEAVTAILQSAGVTAFNIADTAETLSVDKEFEPGREKLFAINELLGAINFVPIHVDVNGYYTSYAYRSPSVRAAEYVYADDRESIITNDTEEELDLTSIPNRWVVTVSNPEQVPLTSVYTNDNPDSLTSTVNQGRVITDFREIEEMASQEALDAYVERIAFDASQVFGKLKFSTALNPLHDYADVLQMNLSGLNIKDKYSETSWTMPLRSGALMTHEVRKVVQI
jgi:hypothetical protein